LIGRKRPSFAHKGRAVENGQNALDIGEVMWFGHNLGSKIVSLVQSAHNVPVQFPIHDNFSFVQKHNMKLFKPHESDK
jgi:hypothetical protein